MVHGVEIVVQWPRDVEISVNQIEVDIMHEHVTKCPQNQIHRIE